MLQKLFKLKENNTSFSREVIAGFTTFAAMAYILAVNPAILSSAGMDREGLITVTAVAAAIGCFIMALLTNYPIALAPGMSTNSYFTFILCIGMQVPWQAALGMVFWNGIIFFLLSVSGIRSKIVKALPHCLQIGVQCGVGFFIAFIGLKNVGIIAGSQATLVTSGDMSSLSSVLVLLGLLAMVILTLKKTPGAIIIAILFITGLGIFIPYHEGNITQLPSGIFSLPKNMNSLFLALDLFYPITHFTQAFPAILTLLLLDLFDSIGTIVGVSRRAGLVDAQGNIPRIEQALTADAMATVIGSVLGTSTTTAYVESATGIESGGRTGLTAIVVGVLFLLALFLTPIIAIVPAQATAPALILVGIFMAQGIKHLQLDRIDEVAPAFLTMIFIPLTFSITEGISIGLIFYCCLMLFTGKYKEVSYVTYLLALLFIIHFALEGIL